MGQPNIWYKDSATWRQINREVWYNDAGTWRKVHQIWYNASGVWHQVYALDFNSFFQGDTSALGNSDSKSGEEAPGRATITWHSTGQVSKTVTDFDDNDQVIYFTGGQWGTPVIPDGSAGVLYEIKVDTYAGSGATGMTSGVWYNLGTNRSVSIQGIPSGSGQRTQDFNVTIRRVSTGAVVATGVCEVSAFNQYVP